MISVAAEQLDAILGLLDVLEDRDAAAKARHAAAHDARRALKRLRALIRLIRGPLGPRYAAANEALRDAARQLGAVRDAAAMVEAIDALDAAYEGVAAEALAPIREALVARRGETADHDQLGADLAAARVGVRAVRDGLDHWPTEPEGFELLAEGLQKTYAGARKRLAAVQVEPGVEVLHEWRKLVKAHRYQLELLGGIAPTPVAARLEGIHRLTDHLGLHHDLDVLEEVLRGEALAEPARIEVALGLADHARAGHRAAALELGHALFDARPKAFVREVRRWWQSGG